MPTQFGMFLLAAMNAAGYPSTTNFARAAGVDPSVVFRWIYGKTAPTTKILAKVAPVLGLTESDLIARAYSTGTSLAESPRVIHPLVAELARLLGDDSPIGTDERQVLETLIDRIVQPYRRRPGRGRKTA